MICNSKQFIMSRDKASIPPCFSIPRFQLLKFSELTTTKLSSDNCLLKDELEMTRGQLVTAKKTLASLETQLETTKLETVGKEESEGRTRLQGEV